MRSVRVVSRRGARERCAGCNRAGVAACRAPRRPHDRTTTKRALRWTGVPVAQYDPSGSCRHRACAPSQRAVHRLPMRSPRRERAPGAHHVLLLLLPLLLLPPRSSHS